MRERRHIGGTPLGVVVLCATLGLSGAASATGMDKQSFGEVEHGRYLTIVADCGSCHTLPGSGHELAGGRPIETPFGTLLAPNITPDAETGIGAWTDDEFVNALTKGTGRNGIQLYPAMPYTYYTRLTRDDALAIRAYLNTIPAVHNTVKSNQLPFPFNMRWTMAIWNELFFRAQTFAPDPHKSAQWNRGAYLAEGPAHCGMCHTPKNFLGADNNSKRLQGYNLQGWFAPNITDDSRRGLGSWSVDDIATYLETGHNKIATTTGLMSETLSLSTSRMRDDDLKAIAVYLKGQPGQSGAPAAAPDRSVMKKGEQIYADECSGCHKPDGSGVPALFPTLKGAPAVQQTDPTSLLRVILRGAKAAGTSRAPTASSMPAFSWILADGQVAAVTTYIRNAWANSAPPVSAGDVQKARQVFVERSD